MDLTGQIFGQVTVLGRSHKIEHAGWFWLCECSCGTRFTRRTDLVKRFKSCGCATRRDPNQGPNASDTPEYKTWIAMRHRCTPDGDPKKRWYHRGIRVCPAWRNDFSAFLRDMGTKPSPQHSLDRIDNDGNYEPGNCRWATAVEQAHNRQNTAATLITYNGRAQSIAEWAVEAGMAYMTLYCRLRSGMSIEEALTKPVKAWGLKLRNPDRKRKDPYLMQVDAAERERIA